MAPSDSFNSFLSDLVRTSHVDIVVDNAKSSESAVEWNNRQRQQRRMRRNSIGSTSRTSLCRWSSNESLDSLQGGHSSSQDFIPSRRTTTRKGNGNDRSSRRRHSNESLYKPPPDPRNVRIWETEKSQSMSRNPKKPIEEHKYTRRNSKLTEIPDKVPVNKFDSKDAALGNALISTIEKLSIRAALALTRPLGEESNQDEAAAIAEAVALGLIKRQS